MSTETNRAERLAFVAGMAHAYASLEYGDGLENVAAMLRGLSAYWSITTADLTPVLQKFEADYSRDTDSEIVDQHGRMIKPSGKCGGLDS